MKNAIKTGRFCEVFSNIFYKTPKRSRRTAAQVQDIRDRAKMMILIWG